MIVNIYCSIKAYVFILTCLRTNLLNIEIDIDIAKFPQYRIDLICLCIDIISYDNVTAEHIVYAHPAIIIHLTKLFNAMIAHGYVPNNFGTSIIVPLV